MRRSRELDGIRGIAISSVVLGHLLSGSSVAGFVGVDIFFVLSGYLIISSFLEDYYVKNPLGFRRANSIIVLRFMFRRIKRLVPMFLVGLSSLILASFILYGPDRGRIALTESVPAILGYENIHLVVKNSDYFVSSNFSNLFQHFWSLALEFQFYFATPMIFLLVQSICKRNYFQSKKQFINSFFVVYSLLTSFSYLYFVHSWIQNDPSIYFNPLSRFWEIGIGALIGISRYVRKTKNFLTSDKSIFSSTIFFILAQVLAFYGDRFQEIAILFGVVSVSSYLLNFDNRKKSTNAIIKYSIFPSLGKVAYSTYIYYWPLSIFIFDVNMEKSLENYVKYILLLSLISFIGFNFIEKPANNKPFPLFLESWRDTKSVFSDFRIANSSIFGLTISGFLFFILLLPFLFFSAVSNESDQTLRTEPSAEVASEATTPSLETDEQNVPNNNQKSVSKQTTKLSHNRTDSSVYSRWRIELSSSIIKKSISAELQGRLGSYLNVRDSVYAKCNQEYVTEGCSFGDSIRNKKLFILGDSHAAELLEPLSDIFSRHGWFIQAYNRSGCNIGSKTIVYRSNGEIDNDCEVHRNFVLSQLENSKPQLVLISENSAFDSITISKLKRIQTYTQGVIYLTFRNGSRNIIDCMDRYFNLEKCFVDPRNADFEENRIRKILKALNIRSISRREWLCVDNFCPPVIADVPVYFDGVHFTPAFSRMIIPLFESQLRDYIDG